MALDAFVRKRSGFSLLVARVHGQLYAAAQLSVDLDDDCYRFSYERFWIILWPGRLRNQFRVAESFPQLLGNVRRIREQQPQKRIYRLFGKRIGLRRGVDKHHHLANSRVHFIYGFCILRDDFDGLVQFFPQRFMAVAGGIR